MTSRRDAKTTRRLQPPTELDHIRELETENALLRARVAELNSRLAASTAPDPQPVPTAEEDASMEAFEAFLAESDPHLDRVQRFLLG